MYYLGFDIGGSSIEAVLVKDKQIIKSITKETPQNLEGLLDLVGKMKSELIDGIAPEEIAGAGFAIAGALDEKREVMLNSPNMQFLNGQPLKKMFEEKTGLPIKLEHDVNCFLQAEKEIGLAKGLKNIVCLTIGMGVGGSWMADGKIQIGAHGGAGEIGHMIIEAGQQLDWEALTANKFVKGKLGISAAEAEGLVRSGDQKAKELFEKRSRNLGIGIANIINIFDPEAIIIGGGVVSAQEFILPGIKEAIEKYVISSKAKKTQILFSQLGNFGGALGASLLFE
jgi:predicted NBD/HSP70 family sugar kinase